MSKRVLAAVLAALLFLAAACGDDDDSASTDDETTTTAADDGDAEGEGEQAAGDFCTAYQELLAGDPTPDAIRGVGEIAPEAAQEPLETLAAGFEEGGEEYFGSDEFNAAFAELGDAAADECADETIEVTAIDYGYEGMPEEVSAGTLAVTLANEGEEFHEMVVFRKNDDAAESFDDIFALEDQSEAEALMTQQGATFAPPGGTASGLFTLEEPGDYVAVCFIPVGTTPEVEEGSGPPHFTQGMKVEFTVS
jgi:plastocyanin